MSPLALALTYTAFTALSLSMNRHARPVLQRELTSPQQLALRIVGWGSLAISLFLALAHSGWPVGAVEWFGMATASAVSLVFLLTYSPRVAAALALGLPVLAASATWLWGQGLI